MSEWDCIMHGENSNIFGGGEFLRDIWVIVMTSSSRGYKTKE